MENTTVFINQPLTFASSAVDGRDEFRIGADVNRLGFGAMRLTGQGI
jgi:hypothetical protein